jgi:phosphohistidine phosphatase SixA
MVAMEAAQETLEMVASHFGAPTTVVNFVKAYLKTAYVKAFKDYFDEIGEDFEEINFIGNLPIKITKKDLDSV